MNFSLATLFLLFAAASCAPAGLSLHDACADVRSSSLELNQIARTVSKEARNGSKDWIDPNTSLVWMEAKDTCDPGTIRHKPLPCIEKMLSVLTSYKSAVEKVAGFRSCSAFASKVKPVMHKLHEDMKGCVKAKGGRHHTKDSHLSEENSQDTARWEEAPLCQYTMDRLFSFSILTARVFAAGDPAHHAEGSAQRCM